MQPSKRLARSLGVTPTGLAALGRAVASPTGVVLAQGTAKSPLLKAGHIAYDRTAYRYTITESGRAIVRQARELGW